MHIVWMILKIIGILLLVVLGIVLALLLAVFFVPVRYRIQVDKEAEGTAKVRAGVGWLLRILYVSVRYEEELHYCVRIFGIPIIRNKNTDILDAEPERADAVKKDKEKRAKLHKTNKKRKSAKTISDETVAKKRISDKKDSEKESIIEKEASIKEGFGEDVKETELSASVTDETETNLDKETASKEREMANSLSTAEHIEDDVEKPTDVLFAEMKQQTKDEKKSRNPFKKLKQFWEKIYTQIRWMIYKIKNLWQNVKEKKVAISEKIGVVIEFWNGEQNQAGKRLILDTGKKLITHILPKKWKGKIRFGLSDPGSTGKALAAFSILYGLIENMPEIIPDFEQEVLEGHFFCKGRIQVFFLVRHIWHMWFHEDFKRVKKNFEKVRRAF